jgi:hypothetical protein
MVSLILLAAAVVSCVVLVAYEFSWPPSIPKAASVQEPGGSAEPAADGMD